MSCGLVTKSSIRMRGLLELVPRAAVTCMYVFCKQSREVISVTCCSRGLISGDFVLVCMVAFDARGNWEETFNGE